MNAQVKRALYYGATSLDGYLADPDDGLEWLLQFEGTYDAPDAEPGPMGEGGGYEQFYDGVGAHVHAPDGYRVARSTDQLVRTARCGVARRGTRG